MAYPDDHEDFTPVVSPEFVRDNHINELQTLLETFEGIFGLFPNWIAGAPALIGEMFLSKSAIALTQISSRDVGNLVLTDVNSVVAVAVKLGGNVGIKNSTPAVELDVTGEINSTYGFYHDRGDPAAHDYTQATLTTDGSWNNLDLSGIVPAGAKTVLLRVILRDGAIGQSLAFRKNGNANTVNAAEVVNQVANINLDTDVMVSCDTDRVIEYNGSNVVWDVIRMTVRGWWK